MQSIKAMKTKVMNWIREHSVVLLITAGIILLVLTLKTQTVLLTDSTNREYTVEMQYSLFGYCVSVHPMTEESKPLAAEHMYLLGGIDETVQKAAEWLAQKTDGGVEVYVSGYPRGKDALTEHLCQMLENSGIAAKELKRDND